MYAIRSYYAVTAASMLCPPEKQAALLLVSDGHETRGSVLAEARLAPTPLPVYPVVPAGDALPLAELRRLLVPPLVAAGKRTQSLAEIEQAARAQSAPRDFAGARITSYNVCYTKLLRGDTLDRGQLVTQVPILN